jgi:hypothetical protein
VLFVFNVLIEGEIEKPCGQFLCLIVMSHRLAEFEFESGIFQLFYLCFLSCVENPTCLSHGVQVAIVTWWAATRIVTGVGDLVQRTGNNRTGQVLGGRRVERSGDCWRS